MRRGFFPSGCGHVDLTVSELVEPLTAIDLSEQGIPKHTTMRCYATQGSPALADTSLEALRHIVQSRIGGTIITEFSLVPALPDGTSRCWVDLVLVTSTGAVFHAGSQPEAVPVGGRADKHLFDVASTAASDAV